MPPLLPLRGKLEAEMDCWKGRGGELNSFALVSYLSDPLAGFLNRLRCDLAPQCAAKAHVTILPPRPLGSSPEEAWQELQRGLQDFQPFRVELGEIAVFPGFQAVYLSIESGRRELERMHARLNTGRLAYEEPFQYYPHLTLVQELASQELAAAMELAAQRWREFRHSRGFTVDKVTFVQNTLENRWTDLAAVDLASHVTL
jgi:2'-5' RNA ligase